MTSSDFDNIPNWPSVSIVIPTHNRKAKVSRLIDSIFASNYPRDKIEIVVVDDASQDSTCQILKDRYPQGRIKLIRNENNLMVAKTRNIGIRNSIGEYLFFIDDDIVLDKGTIRSLVKFLMDDGNKSLVGPVLYNLHRPDYIWSLGVKINFYTTFGKFIGQDVPGNRCCDKPVECDGITCTYMVHRSFIERVGYFNSTLFPTAFEELDFCIRGHFLGYKTLVLPSARAWNEHNKNDFWAEHPFFYFNARNRFIAHKLWSRTKLQCILSKFFSVIFFLMFTFFKNTFYPQNYRQCVRSLCRGLIDGIIMSVKIDTYPDQIRKGVDIKYVE